MGKGTVVTVTAEQLRRVMPAAGARAERYVEPLNTAMRERGILTWVSVAAFLAQIAHESLELRATREIWGPTPAQLQYEPPSPIAQRLGNDQPGDGVRFKGRGLLQITGRENYRKCSWDLYGDNTLLYQPERLELPMAAARSATWFWHTKNLSPIAELGPIGFRDLTRHINGGLNGIEARERYYIAALSALRPPPEH